jgi:hypothetical protein
MTVGDLINLLKAMPTHLTVASFPPGEDDLTEVTADGVTRESNIDYYTGGGKDTGGSWKKGDCVRILGR